MIYLDSANLDEAAVAAEMGFVTGITTNPAILARQEPLPLDQLRDLLRVFPVGPIFYQPSATDETGAEAEAREAHALAPERIVLKLPARLDMFRLASRLSGEGMTCAMTAVYSPAQAIVAHQAGCRWVIPYVDRARRLMKEGEELVTSLSAVLRSLDSPVGILAASLKEPEQVSKAVADGAHAVTIPMNVLDKLGDHPLSNSAIDEFRQEVEKRGWASPKS